MASVQAPGVYEWDRRPPANLLATVAAPTQRVPTTTGRLISRKVSRAPTNSSPPVWS